jgi:hypothetical protein
MLWVAIFVALLWLGIACDVVGPPRVDGGYKVPHFARSIDLTGNLHAGHRRRPEHESSSLVATEYLG